MSRRIIAKSVNKPGRWRGLGKGGEPSKPKQSNKKIKQDDCCKYRYHESRTDYWKHPASKKQSRFLPNRCRISSSKKCEFKDDNHKTCPLARRVRK